MHREPLLGSCYIFKRPAKYVYFMMLNTHFFCLFSHLSSLWPTFWCHFRYILKIIDRFLPALQKYTILKFLEFGTFSVSPFSSNNFMKFSILCAVLHCCSAHSTFVIFFFLSFVHCECVCICEYMFFNFIFGRMFILHSHLFGGRFEQKTRTFFTSCFARFRSISMRVHVKYVELMILWSSFLKPME